VTLAKSARIVAQYQKGLIMRLGKYHAMVGSGLHFLMPFVDQLIRVDSARGSSMWIRRK